MLKPALQLRLGQQLTMTPQLQQAIRLLQLPIVELEVEIQQALEGNVMLEQIEDGPEPEGPEVEALDGAAPEAAPAPEAEGAPAESAEVVAGDGSTLDDSWQDGVSGGSGESNWSGDDDRVADIADLSGETLRDHLLWQLRLERMSPRAFAIGQAIVDAINEDGYLTEALDTICQAVAPEHVVTIEEAEAVLAVVQQLDPAGVGARSLSECLCLQLALLERDTPGLELARRIAAEHLEMVGARQYAALRRRLRVSEEELDQAIALVRTLQPRPGAAIQRSTAEYVVPDVYVRKIGDQWVVEVNPWAAPRIRVNQSYAGAIGRGADHSVLRAQLQEARWLVRSLEIRNETLLKVATRIVERQREFLEHGEEWMKPMVLRDVAEAVSMHESTISRVTTNKYMHTPRGVFEFRYFFSSQVGGEEHSSTAIRALIRKMISNENPDQPLSDSRIAELLVESGVNVARRTVAKYREAMMIPSSAERRHLAPR
jgi:RNA polymerase sigma-54 factor